MLECFCWCSLDSKKLAAVIAKIIKKGFINEEEVNGAFSLVSKREYTKVNSEKH